MTATLLPPPGPPTRYRGWLRPSPRHPWEAVASAPTERQCWRLLREHAEELGGKTDDMAVLPEGQRPRP